MRTINKYLRNRDFRQKAWNRIRSKEHPFETITPYYIDNIAGWTVEEQIKSHFDWITEQSRAIDNGAHCHMFHAPKFFRKMLWKKRKSLERNVMAKIRNGHYDLEMPTFKRDADWVWF